MNLKLVKQFANKLAFLYLGYFHLLFIYYSMIFCSNQCGPIIDLHCMLKWIDRVIDLRINLLKSPVSLPRDMDNFSKSLQTFWIVSYISYHPTWSFLEVRNINIVIKRF